MKYSIIFCLLYVKTWYCESHVINFSQAGSTDDQCALNLRDRFDCDPDRSATEEGCESRGCCWIGNENNDNRIPSCYFPTNYPSYKPDGPPVITETGLTLNISRDQPSPWPNDIRTLRVDVFYETDTRVHIKIYNPLNKRYEVPMAVPKSTSHARQYNLQLSEGSGKFSLTVRREDNKAVLFDSNIEGAPLIFADQFIQMTTMVPSGMLYGLGEHRAPLYHNLTQWQRIAFWARGTFPVENANLYSVHPFFMSFDKDNKAYGIFLLNSNAMDTDLQPTPAITFRPIGGILDFYIFLGPSPDNVIQQYTDVIGKPQMPPYWGLGYHLSRFGYKNIQNLQTVINRTRAAGFPYEAQWTDIDAMNGQRDWTYNPVTFVGLPDVVENLHKEGQHYVMIIDPGTSNQQEAGTYPPYDEGVKMGVFVKNESGHLLEGTGWPGTVVFPDFTNPDSLEYWYQMANRLHSEIPFDSLWTDMTEPSNHVNGSTSGCGNGLLDNPPYTPNITDRRLLVRTLCPSAIQNLSTHYNVHNLYGHYENKATNWALEKLRGRRSFVISRSTFAGTGKYAGHWSGDNAATWHDLQQSIPEILSFQMFGIPMTGVDICGHVGNTTEELCTRWTQLGSFYPFMRNHNRVKDKDQDPAVFSKSAQDAMKSAMFLRYRLLPYLYTLFYYSHLNGTTVARPLSFNFPEDKEARVIDRQLMWGSDLLISPVIDQGHTSVSAYFPSGDWYNFTSGALIQSSGQYITLSAELNVINVHQRAGSVIPTQATAVTTTASRQLPFSLQIALDSNGEATGSLYWDDGDTIDSIEKNLYSLITMTVLNNELKCTTVQSGYKTNMDFESIRILGLQTKPSTVLVNGESFKFEYNEKILYVTHLNVKMDQNISVRWTFS